MTKIILAESRRPAAVVAYMPVADIRPFVGDPSNPALQFDANLAPSFSPVDHVTDDDPPVLLIHGDQDEILPIEDHSLRLKSLFDDAHMTSELLVVPRFGHELFTGQAKATADSAVVEWFDRHLLRGGSR